MPRTADHIFLRLAVQRGYLGQEDAEDLLAELTRLEQEGTPSKARLLCLELGFIDEAVARQLKHEVRTILERQERAVELDSRSERRIAGFELIERLGSGAMGVVFKARHLKLNKVVALKLLNPDFAEDERYVARFLQEAQVAAALNHPNIVQAYDVGQAGDVHYIAMEYVDGKTVKELIERRGHLEEQAAVEIVLQVLDALKHAHSRSLIHRDIKPANIMITRDGRAKVLDLGLARRTDIESGLTGEGRAIGTPYYMAPEQALDKGADYRADIYSLGATLFNMVTGEKPYVAGTPVAVMNMHLKAPIPDAHQVNPAVSEGLARIIKKMLAKRPADRYQDHDALIRDLEGILQGLMPELDGGRPPEGIDYISRPQGPQGRSRPQRAALQQRGKPGLVLVGAAAAGFLVLGLGFLAQAHHDAPPEVPDRPVVDAATERPERAERELAAQALLAEIHKTAAGADDPEANRAQADQLISVADRFPDTDAGRRAREEARRLLSQLDDHERELLDRRKRELDALVAQGKLVEALAGWDEVVAAIDDMRLKSEADAWRNQVRQQVSAQVDRLTREAEDLARAGREREAARTLRRALPLVPESRRGMIQTRVDELEGRAAMREAEARSRAQREDAASREEDERRLEALPGQLIELVQAGKVKEALQAAEAAAAQVNAADLRARATIHRDALAALAGLEVLGAQAIDKLQVGQEVTLDRRQASEVSGKVVRVGNGKVTVGVSSRIEITVGPADLTEDELLRLVRRAFGANHPPYLHGLAALKLYRGDADAEAAVERARAAGVDLAALVDELRTVRERSARRDPEDVQGRVGIDDAMAEEERRRREVDEERARYERERLVYENRHRLFPESEDTGYLNGQALLNYNYFTGSRDFAGQDWRRVRGKSYPTPPGQERIGLVLEGRNGRAEFTVPIEGDFEVSVEFMSQMIGKDGRLTITAETDGQRLETTFGQLVYARRGKARQAAGESQWGSIRPQRRHTLELIRSGDQVLSKFDGAVIGSLTVAEFGRTTLGLEWGDAALNLVQVRLRVTPDAEWVKKKLQ